MKTESAKLMLEKAVQDNKNYYKRADEQSRGKISQQNGRKNQ